MVIIIPMIIVSVIIIIVIAIYWVYVRDFNFPSPVCLSGTCFIVCQLWPTTLGSRKWFNASVMCCEPIETASGQTQWVEVAPCPGFSSILLWYQNTSTRMNTDSRTERAVHSGKTLGGNMRRWGGHRPLSNGTRCRLFHVLHVDLRGQQDLSSSPFLFLSLAGLLDRAEAPGANLTSSSASGPRDFNTFVFSAISV